MNLGLGKPDLIITGIMKQNTNFCEKISPCCIYIIHNGMTGCAEINAVLGLLINHVIIVAPPLP